ITIAQERSILSAEMHGALFLARLYWSTERYDESKEWLYRFRQIRLANPDPAVVGDANVLEANLAIVERQFDRAKECIECARNCRQSQLDLPRLLIAACDVRLRSAKGEEYITDAELATLISLHKRARGIGCQDEAMLAVLNALRWRERRA